MQNLNAADRQLRSNIRAFLLTASIRELRAELRLSLDRGMDFRADCVLELIEEWRAEHPGESED